MGTRPSQLNNHNHSSCVAFGLWVTITAVVVVVAGCARPTAVDDASVDATADGPYSNPQTRQYDSVSERELTQIVSTSAEPILVECGVDFNCARCDQMTPVVNGLVKQYAGQARIVRVRFNPSSGIQSSMGLQVCPSYLFFEGGKLVDRCDGPAMLPVLQSKLSALVTHDAPIQFSDSPSSEHSEHLEVFE